MPRRCGTKRGNRIAIMESDDRIVLSGGVIGLVAGFFWSMIEHSHKGVMIVVGPCIGIMFGIIIALIHKLISWLR
jgi:hypothetical protein